MGGPQAVRFIVVQHAEKQRLPGDPGLTELGRRAAERLAGHLATRCVVALYSSPQRRARETAAPIALALGVPALVDSRLCERMNWEGPEHGPAEGFIAEWRRTVAHRDHVPTGGDSSNAAAARFELFLDEVDGRHRTGPIAVVTHGGVTTDLLRNLMGDERLCRAAPGLFEGGMPPCGLTTLAGSRGGWHVLGIGETPQAPSSAERRR